MLHLRLFVVGIVLVMLASGAQEPPDASPTTVAARPLDEASTAEKKSLDRFRASSSWPDRAIALLRLERYDCERSRGMITAMLTDDAWQVRCFAVRALARRGETMEPGWLDEEAEPRVIRTAVRCRMSYDLDRLTRGINHLSRQSNLDHRTLSVELAAASGDDALIRNAKETVKSVIHRMSRAEAGALSPRLAVLTGERHHHRPGQWQRWALRTGRGMELRGGWMIGPSGEKRPDIGITTMDSAAFARLDRYMQDLGAEELDLTVVIDCTASMSGELAEVQGGIDDLMVFLGHVQKSARIGVVGYRDRREEFVTRWWHLTADVAEARRSLWSLTAEGGGDFPEAVYPALRTAYTELNWDREHRMVLVLVGDGPPHVGYGSTCVDLARRAAAAGLTTHVVQADNKDVKHFKEIAEAGKGRCVSLESDASLIGEITGLTVGEAFEEEIREFFEVYLRVCR